MEGVFDAFRGRPVVALSDVHGLAQEGAFYAALIRDPRFAREVGNVVVEFGGAAHQGTIDRYVNGEDVPYDELRKVWTDLVGWERPPGQMYANVFASIRAANAGLPPERRIHVWLGEPPIDWSRIKTFADLDPYMVQRDTYPAKLVLQLLDRKQKALVIYGGLHFYRGPGGEDAIKQIVERRYPSSVFVIKTYAGHLRPTCVRSFEAKMGWRHKALLVAPIAGSWIASDLRRCTAYPGPVAVLSPSPDFGGAQPAVQPLLRPDPRMLADIADAESGVRANALLYLGPASSLTQTPDDQSLYLDEAYRREIVRRQQIIGLAESANAALDRNTAANTAFVPQ